MTKKTCLRVVATTAVGLLLSISTFCQSSTSASLTGQVISKEEGPMEGVLVSAKRLGSNVTVTVVSDQQGRYRFPQNRLQPGEYAIQIRATGFEMSHTETIKVTAGTTATMDLKLHAIEDFSGQLTSEEWLLSMPGSE